MEYISFLLRRERLARNWSQEGLCQGICTISYLSKIEQGKASPSPDILQLLMHRMELPWFPSTPEKEAFIENAYTALFSHDPDFAAHIRQADPQQFLYSPYGADWLLLKQFIHQGGTPLNEELELCLTKRQLALQRLLQGKYEEAAHLHPSAFFLCAVGGHCYEIGNVPAALEWMQLGYQQAAQEGHPRVMLYCKLIMGNCYSNRRDLPSMQRHYRTARNLALALKDQDNLQSISYNIAATQLETGHYAQALAYFRQKEAPSRMDLHKLAICYEKLDMLQEAQDALDRAYTAEETAWMPEGLSSLMLDTVRLRLTVPDYRTDPSYGAVLLECFRRCRQELSSGYAIFHLPWVLDWYESNRQYKQALQLLKDFPDFSFSSAVRG